MKGKIGKEDDIMYLVLEQKGSQYNGICIDSVHFGIKWYGKTIDEIEFSDWRNLLTRLNVYYKSRPHKDIARAILLVNEKIKQNV